MFCCVPNKEDMITINQMSLRFKNVLSEVIHQVTKRCSDVVCIDRIEKGDVEIKFHCYMLAKSGINGTLRVCEIINEIFEFDPKEPEVPVAETYGNDFTIRIGPSTHDLNKQYRKRSYA